MLIHITEMQLLLPFFSKNCIRVSVMNILFTLPTQNRRPNALTFRVRLTLQFPRSSNQSRANTNTTKAIRSTIVELNANVAQLIRIPIKTQQRRRNVQFAQRWILRSTTLSQPLNNDAIRMFPLLSFYLSGAKVMPAARPS